jgi:homoserine kinase
MPRSPRSVTVSVPGTTANLGPGFDCFGVALTTRNVVRVTRADAGAPPVTGMLAEAGRAFFGKAGKPFAYGVDIRGDVPRSRGLGSSVTVRAGIILGLNALADDPLTQAECLNLVCALEGHPDNAAPAVLGGFTAASNDIIFRTEVASSLKFVTLIPEAEIETKAARRVLPKRVPLGDAVRNVQNASLIAAAFAAKRYDLLAGAFGDTFHQPFRAKLLPGLNQVIEAGTRAGALGGYLSGSGSTIICITQKTPETVGRAMRAALAKHGGSGEVRVLTADNRGAVVRRVS